MTLNVIVNNVVAVDSQISYGGRTSDDWKKMQDFSSENYHGVLIGNGDGYVLLKAEAFVQKTKTDDIDTLVKLLEQEQKSIMRAKEKSYIDQKEETIRNKYRTVSDPAKREDMITREFATEMDNLDKQLQQRVNGSVYLIAFDKRTKQIRKFRLFDHHRTSIEDLENTPVIADGSGGDLSYAYLTTQVSGIDWEKITPPQNMYLIALACAAATANTGVGGYMKIATVGKENVEFLDDTKTNAMVKVCSKQIAGQISKQDALQYVVAIQDGTIDYSHLAKVLDINESDLKLTPTNVHQDVSKFNRTYQLNQK